MSATADPTTAIHMVGYLSHTYTSVMLPARPQTPAGFYMDGT